MAAEAHLALLREGMKTVLAASLVKGGEGGEKTATAASVGLERAAYNSSVRAWRARMPRQSRWVCRLK